MTNVNAMHQKKYIATIDVAQIILEQILRDGHKISDGFDGYLEILSDMRNGRSIDENFHTEIYVCATVSKLTRSFRQAMWWLSVDHIENATINARHYLIVCANLLLGQQSDDEAGVAMIDRLLEEKS